MKFERKHNPHVAVVMMPNGSKEMYPYSVVEVEGGVTNLVQVATVGEEKHNICVWPGNCVVWTYGWETWDYLQEQQKDA